MIIRPYNYLYLPGRAGGQTAYGGTGASEDLELGSTAHATKGYVVALDPVVLCAAAGITASAVQAQGQQPLTKTLNVISTVATDYDVVTMPSAREGSFLWIVNNALKPLQIYPASGDNFQWSGVDASINLYARDNGSIGGHLVAFATDATTWQYAQLATGYGKTGTSSSNWVGSIAMWDFGPSNGYGPVGQLTSAASMSEGVSGSVLTTFDFDFGTSLYQYSNLSFTSTGNRITKFEIGTNNASSFSHAILRLRTFSGGDPKMQFATDGNPANYITMGRDQSVSGDPFEVCLGEDLGAGRLLELQTDGNFSVSKSGKGVWCFGLGSMSTFLGLGATEYMRIYDDGNNGYIVQGVTGAGASHDILIQAHTVTKITIGASAVTFADFPVTPSALPTSNYQCANKLYVDSVAAVTSITNNIDDYVLTATGTGAIQGEPNLQFNGSALTSPAIQASGAAFLIQDDASQDVSLFASAASGETPSLKITGYRAADASRTLSISVGSEFANRVYFRGVGSYYFEGSGGIKTNASIVIGNNSYIGPTSQPTTMYLANTGVVTFLNFPVTPSSAPTTDYQVANKKYVDDNGGCSFGLVNQVPYTNATVDDFNYSANFTFDGSAGKVIGSFEVAHTSGNAILTIDYENTDNGGDPQTCYGENGTIRWAHGMDTGNSNRFVLASNATIRGQTGGMVIDTSDRFGFGAAPLSDTKAYFYTTSDDRLCWFKSTDTTNKNKVIFDYQINNAGSGAGGVWFQNTATTDATYVNFQMGVNGVQGLVAVERPTAANPEGNMYFITRDTTGAIGTGLQIDINRHVLLPQDSKYLKMGVDLDWGMMFNGTDAIVDYDLLNSGTTDFRIRQFGTDKFCILTGGYLSISTMRSGATQAAAGAAAGEPWYTSGHATLPDNVMMMGV